MGGNFIPWGGSLLQRSGAKKVRYEGKVDINMAAQDILRLGAWNNYLFLLGWENLKVVWRSGNHSVQKDAPSHPASLSSTLP